MTSGETLHSGAFLISGDSPPLENGALLIRQGMIADLGPVGELRRRYSNAEHREHDRAILLPTFINAHTHLELTDFPDWAADLNADRKPRNFVDWILMLIGVKRKLSVDAYRHSLRHGIEQSMASGSAAVGDVLAHHDARMQYQGSLLQGCLFLETLGQDPAVITRLKRGLNNVLKSRGPGQMDFGISPHAPYTIRADYLAYIYRLCRRHGLRCTTHLAESPEEVEFVEQGRGALVTRLYPQIGWEGMVPRASGLRPLRWLAEQGGLFPQNLLVHGVQLNREEAELLAKNGMFLALCPRSNDRLNVGRAPIRELRRAGVSLALGTDSRASSDSLSVRDEMIFAHRLFAGDLDAPTLLQMATIGGAQALGLEQRLGSLAVGKDASFQVLQPSAAVATEELFEYLVSVPDTDDLRQVYLHGKSVLPEAAA